MIDRRGPLLSGLCVAGVLAISGMPSMQSPATLAASGTANPPSGIPDQTPNPHSDLIFRATGARSCRDCHAIDKTGALSPRPLENAFVTALRGKAKGIHGPGRFADCLRCHAGGTKGVEKY